MKNKSDTPHSVGSELWNPKSEPNLNDMENRICPKITRISPGTGHVQLTGPGRTEQINSHPASTHCP